jgi:antimicrobial peptide system SdpA family protein
MDTENPIRLPYEQQAATVTYLPEGWKFFTRDAREDVALLYKQDPDGRWERADRGTNASRRNWLGASRAGRNEHIELGILMGSISPSQYGECYERGEDCLKGKRATIRVKNTATKPSFCGTIGLVQSPPIPWAWANSPTTPTLKSKVVVMEVSC